MKNPLTSAIILAGFFCLLASLSRADNEQPLLGPNLLPNPGFEAEPDGALPDGYYVDVKPSPESVVFSSSDPLEGSRALVATKKSSSDDVHIRLSSTDKIALDPGWYCFSFFVKFNDFPEQLTHWAGIHSSSADTKNGCRTYFPSNAGWTLRYLIFEIREFDPTIQAVWNFEWPPEKGQSISLDKPEIRRLNIPDNRQEPVPEITITTDACASGDKTDLPSGDLVQRFSSDQPKGAVLHQQGQKFPPPGLYLLRYRLGLAEPPQNPDKPVCGLFWSGDDGQMTKSVYAEDFGNAGTSLKNFDTYVLYPFGSAPFSVGMGSYENGSFDFESAKASLLRNLGPNELLKTIFEGVDMSKVQH